MGQPVKITRTEHSAMELRALAARSKDAAVVRRLLALALVPEGHSRDGRRGSMAWTDRRCGTEFIATMPEALPVCVPTPVAGRSHC